MILAFWYFRSMISIGESTTSLIILMSLSAAINLTTSNSRVTFFSPRINLLWSLSSFVYRRVFILLRQMHYAKYFTTWIQLYLNNFRLIILLIRCPLALQSILCVSSIVFLRISSLFLSTFSHIFLLSCSSLTYSFLLWPQQFWLLRRNNVKSGKFLTWKSCRSIEAIKSFFEMSDTT